jgi:hypothetical protein
MKGESRKNRMVRQDRKRRVGVGGDAEKQDTEKKGKKERRKEGKKERRKEGNKETRKVEEGKDKEKDTELGRSAPRDQMMYPCQVGKGQTSWRSRGPEVCKEMLSGCLLSRVQPAVPICRGYGTATTANNNNHHHCRRRRRQMSGDSGAFSASRAVFLLRPVAKAADGLDWGCNSSVDSPAQVV